jgi:two-component system phosphate regulon response regulator OmpR
MMSLSSLYAHRTAIGPAPASTVAGAAGPGSVEMAEGKPDVLVVDDEPDIRETISEYLRLHGLDVATAADAAAARAAIEANPAHVVLLDITMPGEDGLSLARWLRERSGLGIIMLTAAGEVVDRVVGLEMGADDYLAKPVNLRELLARVRAVLRRSRAAAAAAAVVQPVAEGSGQLVDLGAYRLDLDGHRLLDANGGDVPLTAMEFDLLKVFLERPNRVLTRDQLLDLAHNRDWEPFDRSIDIRVARLRRKVEADPKHPELIRTVRGAGYMFAPPKRR